MAEEPVPAVIGAWKTTVASIQFLEGGKLGEVSLLPAMCRGQKSSTTVKFTGTWKYGSQEDAGSGAVVQLASVAGDLKCERYFQYSKKQDGEWLTMIGVDADQEPFVRQ